MKYKANDVDVRCAMELNFAITMIALCCVCVHLRLTCGFRVCVCKTIQSKIVYCL